MSNWLLQEEVYRFQEKVCFEEPHSKVRPILITQSDLDLMGRWPWPRAIWPVVQDYLRDTCGVRTIVYDVLFTEPGPDPQADLEFGASLAFKDDTVLAAGVLNTDLLDEVTEEVDPLLLPPLTADMNSILLPTGNLFQKDSVGLVSTRKGERMRQVPLFFIVEGKYVPNLAFLGAMRYGEVGVRLMDFEFGKKVKIRAWERGEDREIPLVGRNEVLLKNYSGLDSFRPVSMGEIFRAMDKGEAIPELKDALVFIGVHDGATDVHLDARGRFSPGVLFHATLASNIMSDHFIVPLGWEVGAVLAFISVLLAFFANYVHQNFHLLRNLRYQAICLGLAFPLILFLCGMVWHGEGQVFRYLLLLGVNGVALSLPMLLRAQNSTVSTYKPMEVLEHGGRDFTPSLLMTAPRPLAVAYERYLQVSSNPAQHVSTVFEERAVRFMAWVHIAALYRSGVPADPALVQLLDKDTGNLRKPLAAGTSIAITSLVRRSLKKAGDDRLIPFGAPKAYRDDFLEERQGGGHYELGNKSRRAGAFEQWAQAICQSTAWSLFAYLEKSSDGGGVIVERLSGTFRLGQETISGEPELHSGHLYLHHRSGYLLDLFPFLLYRDYRETQAQELLEVYQINEEGDVVYKTLDASETVQLKESELLGAIESFGQNFAQRRSALPRNDLFSQGIGRSWSPYSPGDRIGEDWVVLSEIFSQGGLWCFRLGKLRNQTEKRVGLFVSSLYVGQEERQELLVHLGEFEGYPGGNSIKQKGEDGIWLFYADLRFPFFEGESPKAGEAEAALQDFHGRFGLHGALSLRHFVEIEKRIYMLPGRPVDDHGLKGQPLQAFLADSMEKEKDELKRLLNLG